MVNRLYDLNLMPCLDPNRIKDLDKVFAGVFGNVNHRYSSCGELMEDFRQALL